MMMMPSVIFHVELQIFQPSVCINLIDKVMFRKFSLKILLIR